MKKLSSKQDNLFDLIKTLSKAEKRNFKLYALRQAGNSDANFISLFDTMDTLTEYDEMRILKRTSIDKRQLPNTKAHLYRQILISTRILNSRHNISFEIREQIDFARILYDKGLYKQSLKVLDKAKKTALEYHQLTCALEIVEFEKSIEILHVTRSVSSRGESLSRQTGDLCRMIDSTNDLSNISIQLYGLYLKLGYVRSERDLLLVRQFFKPKLDKFREIELSFLEKINYYQACMWYSYIQYDFLNCYKYARKVVYQFDTQPQMRPLFYDFYLKCYSRSMEMLFLMRDHNRLKSSLEHYEGLINDVFSAGQQAIILSRLPLYFNKINIFIMEGDFKKGVEVIPEIETFLEGYGSSLDGHYKILFYYKIACLYFGDDQYLECIKYLQKIICSRDSKVRLDIQCFARILNLIASYESKQDYNIDYQIRSVYSYIIRMNDMHSAQKEIIGFLKKMNTYYASDFKKELAKLHDKLKPLEDHPYERRPFFYLDIISYLESKIKGVSVAKVIQEKYKALQDSKANPHKNNN
ncbi:MAG: hypothetical protein R3Y04_01305 [Rikenellaceae bacterium]